MKVNCVIGAIHDETNELVNKEWYGKKVVELIVEVGKPLKVIFESGTFIVHQVVKEEVEETDRGLWVYTSTKAWRFDWIYE